jgi:dipeptidyl aminopeptidase/acylaminoacyl peptidase
MVNYRGSVGFGREWRDEILGNIGWPEVEDINAGFDDLVARGWVDAARAVIAGWSWGGYLTLLMHGMHPDRFLVGVAGVPVGDYAAGYEEMSPTLQAYDRALLLGAPRRRAAAHGGALSDLVRRPGQGADPVPRRAATTRAARSARC